MQLKSERRAQLRARLAHLRMMVEIRGAELAQESGQDNADASLHDCACVFHMDEELALYPDKGSFEQWRKDRREVWLLEALLGEPHSPMAQPPDEITADTVRGIIRAFVSLVSRLLEDSTGKDNTVGGVLWNVLERNPDVDGWSAWCAVKRMLDVLTREGPTTTTDSFFELLMATALRGE